MDIRNLLDAGQDILGAVSDAVDTGDYAGLAWDIQDILTGSTGSTDSAGSAGGARSEQGYGAGSRGETVRTGAYYTETSRGAAGSSRAARGQGESGCTADGREGPQPVNYFLMRRPDGRAARRRYQIGRAGGICFAGASVLSVLFFAAAWMFGLRPSPLGILVLAFFVLMSAACFAYGYKGRKEQQLIARFYSYAEVIGTREYFPIQEVAAASGQNEERVRKDMETFRGKGMVSYLAMDRGKTTVMLTRRMTQEYEKAESARAAREEEERLRQQLHRQEAADQRRQGGKAAGAAQKKAREAAQETARRTTRETGQETEQEALIREGEEAVRTIRAINDRIPDDDEMSRKLYRLESITQRIFERVRRDPPRAKDIRRLMNYYLPTTIKLLNAYAEIYDQPAGGENVQETKRQIEEAMDTINDAFETLLDGLFEEQAWDIASDIDVMKTMMAQDGLVEETLTDK